VNLKSAFLLSQAAARVMAERGGGKIINIASVLSFQGGILIPAYTAAKSGLAGLTRALGNEWAAKQINVNAIAPGYMITDNTATWADFLGDDIMYNTVKSYVYLKVRILFDPPATSFHVKAMEDQMSELEWRISAHRESKLPSAVPLRF
jgi:NAD(P)-dependent dehydrogenase (short-subunit alcohol dehydrogenase family)